MKCNMSILPPSAFSSSSKDVMASGLVDLREWGEEMRDNYVERRSNHASLYQMHFLFPEGVSPLRFYVLIVHGSGIGGMETRAARRENWCLKKSVHVPDSGRYYFLNRINTFTGELHVMTVWKPSQTAYSVMANIFEITLCSRLMAFA